MTAKSHSFSTKSEADKILLTKDDPIYPIWSSMKARCYNSNNLQYKDYGGRGIIVCERWKYSFSNFCEDMLPRPNNSTLDRIDNKGNYTPNNCKWSTRIEQANNRRSNKCLEYNNKILSIADWERELKISQKTIITRLRRGWTVEKALTTTPYKPMYLQVK